MSKNILNFGFKDRYYENDHINHSKKDIEGMYIFINLKGKGEYKSLISGYKIEANDDETIIDLIKPDEGVCKINKDTHSLSLGLMVSKDFIVENIPLDQHTHNLHHAFEYEKNIKNLSHKKINPKTKTLAYEIIQTPYKNSLDKLYLESKALEILHTELNSLLTNKFHNDTYIKFSKQDKEAIYYAREILMNNISNPPSLQELSYKVKINQTKLKYGFKRFFNQTPYSTSLESRLQEAKKLLESSEYNISEIALQVGYKYTQSFSNAFYKRFKIRPKDLMKSRTYYY